jgi:hypothetical protein
MWSTVFAVDPGSSTGWVSVAVIAPEDDPVILRAGTSRLEEAGEIFTRMVGTVDEVVAEKFTIAPRTITGTRSGPEDALGVLGILRWVCWREKRHLTLQSPATAKNAVPDSMLKQYEWYQQLKTPHERDAMRHALVAMRRSRAWLPRSADNPAGRQT